MDIARVVISIMIMAGVTVFTRYFPFLFFRNKQLPPWVDYLQRYTPPIIMTVLVVYSLSSVVWIDPPYGLPEIICVLLVAGLHLWKRNPMLSIFGGTGVYMALVQTGVISRLFDLV